MGFITGFKKYRKELGKLHTQNDGNLLKLFIDSVWSRVKYGCVLNHYTIGNFYKRSSFERKKIFTYRDWEKVVSSVNDIQSIHYLQNKVDFNSFFSDFIGRDWLYSKDMRFEEYEMFCSKHNEAIVKPMKGLEGNGVMLQTLPQNPIDIQESYERLKSLDVLIEEKIIQHPNMIFENKSVNTIRVYTAYNSQTKEVSIIKTVIRVGVGDSIVDNSHSGGCAYEIDKESGYIISPFYANNRISSFIHPNTHICMIGKKIPFWDEVIEISIKGAKKLPNCCFIGWDVAITKNGPLLIEGNHMPDLDMIEFVGSYGYKSLIMKGLGL